MNPTPLGIRGRDKIKQQDSYRNIFLAIPLGGGCFKQKRYDGSKETLQLSSVNFVVKNSNTTIL